MKEAIIYLLFDNWCNSEHEPEVKEAMDKAISTLFYYRSQCFQSRCQRMPENVPGITCRQSRKMIHNCSIGYTGGKRIMHKPKKQQPIVNYPLYKGAAIRIFAENPGNWEAFKRLVSTAARHR